WEQAEEFRDLPLFVRHGPWWARRYRLNHRGDGSCIFLSKEGRCRIHERFGAEAKPLACRIYPFMLIPAGGRWRVGLRFACPSAAKSEGRPLSVHETSLIHLGRELEQRTGQNLATLPPPPLQAGQAVAWPDLLRFVQALTALVRDSRTPLEHRLRKCLALEN